jgi:hypothetical protein
LGDEAPCKIAVINSSKEIWWILTLYMILERKLMF